MLHPWAVITLYPNNLYYLSKDTNTVIDQAHTQNEELKSIIVLVNRMEEMEKNLLEKILNDCNYTLNDVSLQVLCEEKWSFNLTDNSKKIILSFGIEKEQIHFLSPLYDFIEKRAHEHIVLSVPALSEVAKNSEYKRLLWKSLQKIFLLSLK